MFSACVKQVRRLALDLDAKSIAVFHHGVAGVIFTSDFHLGAIFTSGYSSKDSLVASPIKRRSHVASWEGALNGGKESTSADIDRRVPKLSTQASKKLDVRGASGDSWHDIDIDIDDVPRDRKKTFKSVYELAPTKTPVTKTKALQRFTDEFWECFPESRIMAMKHNKHEAGFRVIMYVSLKDVLLNMPYRTVCTLLAPVPCYYLSKLAPHYLSISPNQAILLGTSFSLFIYYKYLSSICTIKHNPTSATYAAVFPFRFGSNQKIKFRKNHVRPITTETDFFHTCHVTIKGKKAFCPRSCFTTTHHYEELLRPSKTNEMKSKL